MTVLKQPLTSTLILGAWLMVGALPVMAQEVPLPTPAPAPTVAEPDTAAPPVDAHGSATHAPATPAPASATPTPSRTGAPQSSSLPLGPGGTIVIPKSLATPQASPTAWSSDRTVPPAPAASSTSSTTAGPSGSTRQPAATAAPDTAGAAGWHVAPTAAPAKPGPTHPGLAQEAWDVLEQALVEESVHQKFDDFSEGAGTAALQRLSPLAYLDLMRDLARLPEPQVRRRAVATLGKMSGSAAAAVVRQALHDPALVVRMEAAAILGERGDKHVLSIYQRDLKLANHDDRYVILQSVKRIQHKWAVDPLRQFAGHGDPFIEVAACEALCKLGDEKAYIALRKAMKSDNKYVRSSAYAAVKDIGGQRAAPLLRKALRDADPAIRMYAAVYLARMNNAGGLHVLRHVLQTDVNPTVRYMVMDAAAQLLDKRVLPVLRLGLTDSSADVRLAAADALLQRGDAQGLTVLRNSLAEGDVPVRLKAVAAARRFRGDGAIDVLGAALVDRSRHVRLAAVDALSERVNVRHHELLANTLRDGDAAVRVAAAVLMVRLDDPAGAAALQKFVAPDAVERAEVLKALESQQAPQFVSYLGTLAENGEEVARVRATVALGKQQNAAAAERLQRLALSTAPMAVRQAAVEALTAMPAEVSTGALHGLLGETLPSGVRYAAAATLGERGDTTAVPVLRQAVAAHDLRAARALCKMGDVGGVELYRQSLKAVDLGERIEAAVVLYRLDRQMGME